MTPPSDSPLQTRTSPLSTSSPGPRISVGTPCRDGSSLGGFAPKHYLQQFHPKYAGKEAVDKLVKAAGYDNWVSFLKFKNDWAFNPELPTVAAWKTTSPINSSHLGPGT